MFGASAYMSQEDLDASEAIRDVEATWSQRQKDGLYPIYGAEGMQKLWGGCIDAWTASRDFHSRARSARCHV